MDLTLHNRNLGRIKWPRRGSGTKSTANARIRPVSSESSDCRKFWLYAMWA